MNGRIRSVAIELSNHAPFTLFGALIGLIIIFVLVYGNLLYQISPISENIFYVLHAIHVFLSALVTTTLYIRYGKRKLWLAVIIGYTGAIGIATISDSIIPFFGEVLLNLPNAGIHVGFIEEPLLTNIPAIIGIMLGYFKGFTKFPHFGHVLISTWASLFHVIMAIGIYVNVIQIFFILIFLFLAVWVPCCTSDIVYPLIFKKKIITKN
ncbi:hypothetical protein ACFL1L_00735 [Thermoplasmatota archaeon]